MRVKLTMIALAAAALASAQNKVGVINIQQAIIQTKDGQKAAQELQAKFEPRRKEVEAKNAEIEGKKTQLRNMANTASEEMRRKLTNEIDQLSRSLQRFQEDAEAEFQGEQQKALQELGGRIMQVIDNYGKTNGFSVILDVSSQQSPVIWIATGIEITNDVIALYDKNAPSTMNPSAPAKPTAAPPAAAPKKPAGVKE